MIRRLYIEKKPSFRQEAQLLRDDLRAALNLSELHDLRIALRYDVEGVADSDWETVKTTVFAELPVESAYDEVLPTQSGDQLFAVEFLPGQYDQRADSAEQCTELVTRKRPHVASATIYVLEGDLSDLDVARVKTYLINAVDSREALLDKPNSLERLAKDPEPVPALLDFIHADEKAREKIRSALGLAMTSADLAFCQSYFRDTEERDPTLTEIKLLDTYWSDHCRHTTFLTEITHVTIAESPLTGPINAAWANYRAIRDQLYGAETERPVCMMDLACIAAKHLRRLGKLDDLEVSEEINAASIVVPVTIDDQVEPWLVMFKNETHNHPTEIEPFGGAATCLGGAIRDPLSGRSYVYQAMRVTGAADPRVPYAETLPGKLPQKKITRGAAHGYSSYGNQIGLATGMVHEVYHPGYVAKRMEIGAVIAATPQSHVRREEPIPGDVIVVVGGPTGRDGVGGATGSSKEHDTTALENSAEVQKGDPVCERKLQRLFRRKDVATLIKRCNDFGAGGVSVAIGELAPSLEIDLDSIPTKYDGLDGTELALSESQERMAVVLDPADVDAFKTAALSENLVAVVAAKVTDSGRLKMNWRGTTIVDLDRNFLDTNGVRCTSTVEITAPSTENNPLTSTREIKDLQAAWLESIGALPNASQRGLIEMFDSTIGAGSVLHPFGGKTQSTQTEAMAALIPVLKGKTTTATLMSFGFDPEIASWSPYHGALIAVLDSVARIVATGGDLARIRLTFQEYFERLREDPKRWGKPFAALLGALDAQTKLEIGAVGGKDSMSGSFNELDVPPTLVSFAVAPVDARIVISPEFKSAGNTLAQIAIPRDGNGLPNLDAVPAIYATVTQAIAGGTILSARALRRGGIAQAVSEMAFGNQLGVHFNEILSASDLFRPLFGDLLVEVPSATDAQVLGAQIIGTITEEHSIRFGTTQIDLHTAKSAWEKPLESVFPTTLPTPVTPVAHLRFEPRKPLIALHKVARPRVVIPVFPGTNCEYDSARAFQQAGAEVETVLFRNSSPQDIEASIAELEQAIRKSQILMIPGGFSAGDEPAGSGKFISAVFRSHRLTDATMDLLKNRDGLALGICNGFQALIKLGLITHGHIQPQDERDGTLTHNLLGRHVSCYAQTKIVSKKSPWLTQCKLGEEHLIAMSHGEGRIVATDEMVQNWISQDQIAIQYVNPQGQPTLELPYNPNGSAHAIEALTSPCGRILGKMGHSERAGPFIGKNLTGNKDQPIFQAGIAYFA